MKDFHHFTSKHSRSFKIFKSWRPPHPKLQIFWLVEYWGCTIHSSLSDWDMHKQTYSEEVELLCARRVFTTQNEPQMTSVGMISNNTQIVFNIHQILSTTLPVAPASFFCHLILPFFVIQLCTGGWLGLPPEPSWLVGADTILAGAISESPGIGHGNGIGHLFSGTNNLKQTKFRCWGNLDLLPRTLRHGTAWNSAGRWSSISPPAFQRDGPRVLAESCCPHVPKQREQAPHIHFTKFFKDLRSSCDTNRTRVTNRSDRIRTCFHYAYSSVATACRSSAQHPAKHQWMARSPSMIP